MHEDFEGCYRAVQSRDPRFDGWFITAVTSTGIYCRPSCPARTPKRANIRFYADAAAAQSDGFRACLRCRPDAAPGSPEWRWRTDVAARAMRLIADGVVDREGVGGLAHRLGYSVRQLQRVLVAEVGTGALALARAQRAQTARLLLQTTALPVADVAFAAGFDSLRQFNDTVRAVFAVTPTELRRKAPSNGPAGPAAARRRGGGLGARPTTGGSLGTPGSATGGPWGQTVNLRLACRRPFDAPNLLDFLARRAVAGVEGVTDGAYSRSLRLPHGPGVLTVRPEEDGVSASVQLADLRDLGTAVSGCRRLLDLDADPVAVDEALGADPTLGPMVRRSPGRRLPTTVDGAELAVRSVLGQQVSVAGARTLTSRLVAAAGSELPAPVGPVTHVFPTPEELLALHDTAPGAFAGPASRRRTLVALCKALDGGDVVIDPGTDPAELRVALRSLPGIGPWTTEYVVLRGLGDPDAFLPTDLGVRRALERLGLAADPKGAAGVAERWRPWRAYALMHLWSDSPQEPPSAIPRARSPRAVRSAVPERSSIRRPQRSTV